MNSFSNQKIRFFHNLESFIIKSKKVGSSQTTNYNNITIQNCFVNASSNNDVGGMIGKSNGDQITNCHNLAFPSNPNNQLVIGNNNVGGLVGTLITTNTTISKSGVSNGKITGSNSVGKKNNPNHFLNFIFLFANLFFFQLSLFIIIKIKKEE